MVAAEAPADTQTQGNQASVHLHSDAQKEALDRQINPRGEPTPMELPPQAQQAADAPSADEAAMEGDDSPSGTADHSSTKEVTAPQDDKSPSSPALVEVAEGAGAKEGADADTATITASTDGGASDAPSPSGGDKGVPEAALEGGQGAPPKGESTPVELPAEAEKPAQARHQRHVSMLFLLSSFASAIVGASDQSIATGPKLVMFCFFLLLGYMMLRTPTATLFLFMHCMIILTGQSMQLGQVCTRWSPAWHNEQLSLVCQPMLGAY